MAGGARRLLEAGPVSAGLVWTRGEHSGELGDGSTDPGTRDGVGPSVTRAWNDARAKGTSLGGSWEGSGVRAQAAPLSYPEEGEMDREPPRTEPRKEEPPSGRAESALHTHTSPHTEPPVSKPTRQVWLPVTRSVSRPAGERREHFLRSTLLLEAKQAN